MSEALRQVMQFAGAIVLLVSFVTQLDTIERQSVRYLMANAVGSLILAVVAVWGADHGFALLEGAWAVASIVGLVRIGRAKRADKARDRVQRT